MNAVSIVIPTLNEVDNIPVLVKRIADCFANSGIKYEIVFIDDHSRDNTPAVIKQLSDNFPISFAYKIGSRGKAYSLLQGFKMAQYDVICMIDADLQYPPEAIIPMYRLMTANKVDMVLSEREDHENSKLRQLSSKVFNFVFTRALFGFNYDSQSGLKIFKKSVISQAKLSPTPWSFDLEFIVRALENNYKILSHKIAFSNRYSGQAKVRVAKVTYELAKASIRLRFNSSPSKVKEGYRMNLLIAERMMSFMIIPLMGLLVAGWMILPHKVSALPVVDQTLTNLSPSLTPITSLVSPSQNQFTPTLQPINDSKAVLGGTTGAENQMYVQPSVALGQLPPTNLNQTQPSLIKITSSRKPLDSGTTITRALQGSNHPVGSGMRFTYVKPTNQRFKWAIFPLSVMSGIAFLTLMVTSYNTKRVSLVSKFFGRVFSDA